MSKQDFLVLIREQIEDGAAGKILAKEGSEPVELISVDAPNAVTGIETAEKLAVAKAAKAGLFDPEKDRVPKVRLLPFRTPAQLKEELKKK